MSTDAAVRNGDFSDAVKLRLFDGIEPEKAAALLRRCGAAVRELGRGDVVIIQESDVRELGVVLSGRLAGTRLRRSGDETLVNIFSAGELFGELLSVTGSRSPVTITAETEGRVLLIPAAALKTPHDGLEREQLALYSNIVRDVSGKYFVLMNRLELTSVKSLRGRIALYLLRRQSAENGAIPAEGTRLETARALNCERSAFCRELSRMKADGLIDYDRAFYYIKDAGRLREIT